MRLVVTRALGALLVGLVLVGCERPEPIVTYTVPTKLPPELQPSRDRMLAVMVPKDDQVWFFKVRGPEKAVSSIEPAFRKFVESIQFADDQPVLTELPEGWRQGSEKVAMRFATLNVDTPGKQLGVAVSKLGRQDDWDEFVKINVNRWRGQVGLDPSTDKWADGEPIEIAVADGPGVWVNLLAASDAGDAASPPVAASGMPMRRPKPPTPAEPDPRLKFDRPDGWRDGEMRSMRMAAFKAGPPDSQAELTVIPAGGDLRANVARWLGQVRQGEVPEEVVDRAMADAKTVDVDGRQGQRFLLAGEDSDRGTAIDATIVPIGNGMSLFVKMTGPAKTVSDQSEQIASFLQSLELNL